jgi:transposase
LAAAVRPLLEARKAFEQEADDLDRKVHNRARYDARKFITVLGLGPITVLCFKVTIDDPARFRRSRSVAFGSHMSCAHYILSHSEAGQLTSS